MQSFTNADGSVSLGGGSYDNGQPASGKGDPVAIPPSPYSPAMPITVIDAPQPVLIAPGAEDAPPVVSPSSGPIAPASGGSGTVAGGPKPPEDAQPIEVLGGNPILTQLPAPAPSSGKLPTGAVSPAAAAFAADGAPATAPANTRTRWAVWASLMATVVLFLVVGSRDDKASK